MISFEAASLAHLKTFAAINPAAMQAFQELSRLAFADGAIPARTKELIAVAVAISKQCTYCIDIHAKKAKSLGVSEQEIADVAMVAAAIGAGAAMTHGTHAM
jgi:AhpD family alkylhydroperoxidase